MEIQNSLGYLLGTSSRLIKRKMDKYLEQHHLTTVQWAVIKVLDTKGISSPAKIAEELNSDRATMGSVIDKLTEKKYVEKKLDTKDRRSYMISLTKDGYKILPEIESYAKKIILDSLCDIDEDEIDIFYKVIYKIISNLSKGE